MGSALDMVIKIRNNLELLNKRRSRFKTVRDTYFHIKQKNLAFKDSSDLSKDELIQLRFKIRAQLKKEFRKRLIWSAALSIITISIILRLVYAYISGKYVIF